jgi:exonuclease SbcC
LEKEKILRIELEKKGQQGIVSNRKKDLEAQKQKLDEEIRNIGFDESVYEQIIFKLRARELEIKNYEESFTALSIECEKLQSQIEETATMIKYLEVRENRNKQITKELGDIETFESIVVGFREYVSEKIRPHLSFLASKYVSVLTGNRITAINLAKDFTYQVIAGDEVVTLLSGGEEDIISLGLRLALSELILQREGFKFELLVLDEVFGYLDSERRLETLNLLYNFKSIFSQIVLISHIEAVQEFADLTVRFDINPETGAAVVKQVD